ncbi:MAG: hypothetical protein FWG44_05185 [Oscillospiraceae bacterium]|nr:hypothetical protein [Oscillospiraceae bacterium]
MAKCYVCETKLGVFAKKKIYFDGVDLCPDCYQQEKEKKEKEYNRIKSIFKATQSYDTGGVNSYCGLYKDVIRFEIDDENRIICLRGGIFAYLSDITEMSVGDVPDPFQNPVSNYKSYFIIYKIPGTEIKKTTAIAVKDDQYELIGFLEKLKNDTL